MQIMQCSFYITGKYHVAVYTHLQTPFKSQPLQEATLQNRLLRISFCCEDVYEIAMWFPSVLRHYIPASEAVRLIPCDNDVIQHLDRQRLQGLHERFRQPQIIGGWPRSAGGMIMDKHD